MFTLPRQDFPSGVSQITLFGASGQPLAERLVFVNNYKPLKINISAPQDVYKPRELVKMDISVTDADGRPVEADLSLSVTDAAQVIDTSRFEMNILTQMLLQSDLRGRITDPGYYVGDSTMASRKALEMLMLTQGWRRYDLSSALDEATPVVLQRRIPSVNKAPSSIDQRRVRICRARRFLYAYRGVPGPWLVIAAYER